VTFARAKGASSAATEMRKTIGVKKPTLSEKIGRFIIKLSGAARNKPRQNPPELLALYGDSEI